MEPEETKWRARFRRMMRDLPADFERAKPLAEAMNRAFHAELATAIGPRLDARLQALPQDTYAERQAVSTWCNQELRNLRLCIRCPKTGRPAILLADISGREGAIPRFRLQVRDVQGQISRSWSARELVDFELMEDPPRREGLARWRKTHTDDGPSR